MQTGMFKLPADSKEFLVEALKKMGDMQKEHAKRQEKERHATN